MYPFLLFFGLMRSEPFCLVISEWFFVVLSTNYMHLLLREESRAAEQIVARAFKGNN